MSIVLHSKLILRKLSFPFLGCGPYEACPIDYRGKEFDEIWQIKYVYRSFLRNNHRGITKMTPKHWEVFGSIQHEHFDPLAYSKKVGDYPPGGAPTGASWKALGISIFG